MKKYLLIVATLTLALVACTPNNPDPEPQQPGTQELPDEPLGNPMVTTGDATNVTSIGAFFVCSYSGAPSTGVLERGIRYGTAIDNLNRSYTLDSSTGRSGSFTITLQSLEPATKYFYQAYITVWDGVNKKYVDITGILRAFTTTGGGDTPGDEDDPGGGNNPGGGDNPGGGGSTVVNGLQYLGGYEIPEIALQNKDACSESGSDECGPWFTYFTTNTNQRVVTHAYTYNGKKYRNWTALVDGTKKAPLWTSFVMQKDAYPDNNAGRNDSWRDDPAIPSSWQQGGISQPYSRGHLVASNYRQTSVNQNKQTFYHTNQAPQYQTSFNDGVWNSLEQAVKGNAPSGRDTLYVVVGLLYETDKVVDGIPVPSHFYKLLMKCSFDTSGEMTAAKGCAYIFTNESHSGDRYSDSKFRTSIDAIEERTGWNFFVNVPSSLQDTAEAQTSAIW